MINDAQVIGSCHDFYGLQHLIRMRKDALKISNITLSELSGLPDGLTNKLLSAPPYAKLGIMSTGYLLQALGLKLIVVEDAELMRRYSGQHFRRAEKQVRLPPANRIQNYKRAFALKGARASLKVISAQQRRANGRKGALVRLSSTTPEQRLAWARKAARERWRKYGAIRGKRKPSNGRVV
jgi:hypothetical protein